MPTKIYSLESVPNPHSSELTEIKFDSERERGIWQFALEDAKRVYQSYVSPEFPSASGGRKNAQYPPDSEYEASLLRGKRKFGEMNKAERELYATAFDSVFQLGYPPSNHS